MGEATVVVEAATAVAPTLSSAIRATCGSSAWALHDLGATGGASAMVGGAVLHYSASSQRIAWLLGLGRAMTHRPNVAERSRPTPVSLC